MSEVSHLTAVLACVRTDGKNKLEITVCGAMGLDSCDCSRISTFGHTRRSHRKIPGSCQRTRASFMKVAAHKKIVERGMECTYASFSANVGIYRKK